MLGPGIGQLWHHIKMAIQVTDLYGLGLVMVQYLWGKLRPKESWDLPETAGTAFFHAI